MEASRKTLLSQLPPEMLNFTLRQLETGPRLGSLIAKQCPVTIKTPHYVVPMSRGVIPHMSHDIVQRHTTISVAYVSLEDFIEKSPRDAPIFKTPTSANESPLRRYIALPLSCVSILGPRRVPAIACPTQSTNSAVSISTSVGFRSLSVEDYIEACQRLRPDISVSLADSVATDKLSDKRIEKCADRTHTWLRNTLHAEDEQSRSELVLFASIPPVEKEQKSVYLSDLADGFRPHLLGLNLFSPSTITAIPDSLHELPRLCLTDPASPHDVISAVALGVDLITTPFVSKTSEYGMAFSFNFPSETTSNSVPLAFDLWSVSYATSLEPLTPGCTCYTCTRHHRAYIHHLLQAKEMLAWTLLQIHNFAILDVFFAGIHKSLATGTFEQDSDAFGRAYEAKMPTQTGQGPRVRGYQLKSVGGGEPKKNPKAYGRLDDQSQKAAKAEDGVFRSGMPAADLEEQGFAMKAD